MFALEIHICGVTYFGIDVEAILQVADISRYIGREFSFCPATVLIGEEFGYQH